MPAAPVQLPRPPLLIALPQGLVVSGVTLWAVRLANTLAARGRGAALLVHPEAPGHARLALEIDDRVRVTRLAQVPPLGQAGLNRYLPHYRAAAVALGDRFGWPVVLSPNLHGDCYGLGAALTRDPTIGPRLRLIGWQHSDIEYDARVLAHYEASLSRFVAVSEHIGAALRSRLAARSADVAAIPYGVEVPTRLDRPGWSTSGEPSAPPAAAPGPLRLVYAGRLEHRQKRILALPMLSRELARRATPHTLTILGDGPAAPDLRDACRDEPGIQLLPPASPGAIPRLLDQHDAFLLPSRYEGLSVAMLEAMARGCVPIISRTDSGALQAIADGANGFIAEVSPDADEPDAALALADSIGRFLALGPDGRAAMARTAWQTARDRFSLEHHADRVEALLDAVASEPARAWPADQPCAFTATGRAGAPGAPAPGTGSVPADGPRRMAAVLRGLAGRRVAIHGTGEHTRQLRAIILDSPAEIVAFIDDDRARQGTTLWGRPVIAPRDLAATGATEVVISSWMHEDAIWSRRAPLERIGVRVHRVYVSAPGPSR